MVRNVERGAQMTDKQDEKAFEFNGTWREYAPIAFTNLLLTIVTLGIYRFWATARTRRYLWSLTCSPDCYQSEVESGPFMMVV